MGWGVRLRALFIGVSVLLAFFAGEVSAATQIKSVQASAPVMDAGKVIGVIHAGITTE